MSPSTLEALQSALAGRYEIEHEVGRGGMATVYLGRDLRLDRRVAVKVFTDTGGQSLGSERFLREVRIAAQMQHPNILPVHDTGETEGIVYYIMPYVPGATLRERLAREGPLPLAEAVQIARDVALALEHAHAQGIVHRDVKPDNIMLAGGVAALADFGIARAIAESGRLTDTGMAVGTPVYMSPEQIAADPRVDGRTDIYSLGCVLYEMLTGGPPFGGPTAQAVMARHSNDPVPPIQTVREVPQRLDDAVRRALAKQPADRWPSARAFADVLMGALPTGANTIDAPSTGRRRRLGVAVAALALVTVAAGAAWIAVARRTPAGSGTLRSVAVLPFTMSGDTTNSGLADGIAEGVSTGLVQVEGLAVLSGARVEPFRARATDVLGAGRELRVGNVLSASVRVIGNRMRVTAQLTDVASGRALWQEQFSGELVVNGQLQDVFTIQDEITARIVAALRPQLTAAAHPPRARGVRTRDPEAYRLYLEARRERNHFTPDANERAIALLNEALARDSLFADAWVALARTLLNRHELAGGRASSHEFAIEMRNAIERGISIDSVNADAFAARSILRLNYDWDWDGARADVERAVRLAPASAEVVHTRGAQLIFTSQPDSALAYLRRAVAIDPTNPVYHASLALRSAWVGQHDSSLAASHQAIELDSLHPLAYYAQVYAYTAARRRTDADSAAARFVRLIGGTPWVESLLADYYRRTGRIDSARDLLERFREVAQREYVPPCRIGGVLLALGDRAGALDALEESARNRDLNLMFDMSNLYYSLSGVPRFEAVKRRVFGYRPIPKFIHP